MDNPKRPPSSGYRSQEGEDELSRYSHLYIEQTAPLPDSERARHRLGTLMKGLMTTPEARSLGHLLERELGVPVRITAPYDFPPFTAKCAIRDFLDAVTITRTYFSRQGNGSANWVKEARRIFSEERLAYEIDDVGVVHPAVDKEYQRNRQACQRRRDFAAAGRSKIAARTQARRPPIGGLLACRVSFLRGRVRRRF